MRVLEINGMTKCPYAEVDELIKFLHQRSVRPEIQLKKDPSPMLTESDCKTLFFIYIYIK